MINFGDSEILIGSRKIGPQHEPYIIAEMSGNHNQSLDRALKLVDAAAEAGAHALKLQTYTADTITLDAQGNDFEIQDADNLWSGQNLYKLYQAAHTPWDWHKPIFDYAKSLGLDAFSSPFDETAVDFLEELDVPAYKIASFENIHLPLIKKVAATGKPIIMSTGMATLSEIDEAVNTARAAGCRNLILLKCTSTYPAAAVNSNILTIPHMNKAFDCQVGLSDHTMGIGVAVAAVALGASVIEKHFTLSRADGGVDSSFSLEPTELNNLVIETKRAWKALGKINFGPTEAEKKSLKFRRSIYVAEDVPKGEIFTEKNLRIIRPGLGLHPRFYEQFLGRKTSRAIKKGEPLSWEM